MSEDAKKYRAEMRTKAYRIANQSDEPVDASDWRRTADDLTDKKKVTIKQGPLEKCDSGPSNPREYANGGRVARKNGGRMPRKGRDMGGAMQQQAPMNPALSNGQMIGNSAVPSALLNPHGAIRGSTFLKSGGAARADGGGIHIKASHKGMLHKELGVAGGKKIPEKKLAKAADSSNPAERKRAVFAENAKKWSHRAKGGAVAQDPDVSGTRPTGGRIAKASGGRAGKGKMNVNIIIAQKPDSVMGQGMPPGPPPPMRLGMPPPPGSMPGAPGGGAPMPMGGGAPPMPQGMPARPPMPGGPNMPPPSMMGRKSGGRVDYPLDAGSGGGRGRLEKAKAYGP